MKKMKWYYDEMECSWSAQSCTQDGGVPLSWIISIHRSGRFILVWTDYELTQSRIKFSTLRDAQRYCEEKEDEFVRDAKDEEC